MSSFQTDDCTLIHVNHVMRAKNLRKVIVASPDTVVFVNLVYHFTCWIYADLEQLSEVGLQRRSLEKVFWKYAANLRENTHAEVWFL